MINKDNAVALTDFVEGICTDPLFIGGIHCPPVEQCPAPNMAQCSEYTCGQCWQDYMEDVQD